MQKHLFLTTKCKIQPFCRMVSRHPVAQSQKICCLVFRAFPILLHGFAQSGSIRHLDAFGMIIYQLQILNILHLLYKMNVPCLTCSFWESKCCTIECCQQLWIIFRFKQCLVYGHDFYRLMLLNGPWEIVVQWWSMRRLNTFTTTIMKTDDQQKVDTLEIQHRSLKIDGFKTKK